MNFAAMTTLGVAQHMKKDWLTPETLDMIEWKRSARLAGNTMEYQRLTISCKDKIQQDKQNWANEIATKAEQEQASRRIMDAFSNFQRLRSAGP